MTTFLNKAMITFLLGVIYAFTFFMGMAFTLETSEIMRWAIIGVSLIPWLLMATVGWSK